MEKEEWKSERDIDKVAGKEIEEYEYLLLRL